MLTLKNIRKRYGVQHVLENVSFSVGEGQKIALVGLNGVGKSTLLKIIAGLETHDRGEILKPNRVLLGYLPQEALAKSRETLLQYLRRMTGLTELEAEMKTLEPQLEQPERLARYELLQEEYVRLGGYDFLRTAQQILHGLALSSIALGRLVSELSGGEKRKAALAGVLLRGVDVLLLDEPTNNLDLPALVWLEQYLKHSDTTCIIASHDRSFLDAVVEKVIEIDWYKRDVTLYTGGWSVFAEMKAHKIRKHKEAYRAQEEERARLLLSIDQKMDWVERIALKKAPDHDTFASHYKKERATRKFTNSAKALQGRQKRLNAINKPLMREPLMISFAESIVKSTDGILALKKVRFGYHNVVGTPLSSSAPFVGGPVDMEIPFGSRIAILGNNGAGKSTLLKTLAGELAPLSGKRICGEKLRFGYVMQEHENITREMTPLTLFQKRLGIYDRDAVAERLAQFQFSPDILNDKISTFSPGERVRLIFALMSALGINVLLLDEPTNHLDLEMIEALEEALEGYGGTIILITHDRRFLERVRFTERYMLDKGMLSRVASYETYVQKIMQKKGF